MFLLLVIYLKLVTELVRPRICPKTQYHAKPIHRYVACCMLILNHHIRGTNGVSLIIPRQSIRTYFQQSAGSFFRTLRLVCDALPHPELGKSQIHINKDLYFPELVACSFLDSILSVNSVSHVTARVINKHCMHTV